MEQDTELSMYYEKYLDEYRKDCQADYWIFEYNKDEEIMSISVTRTNSIKDFLLRNGIPERQIKRSPSAIIFNPD